MLDPDLIEWTDNPYYGRVCGFREDQVLFERVRQGLVWEPHLVEQFAKHIRPGSISIDCGANIGLHTLAMLREQPWVAEVVAFEAHPETFPLLMANVEGNEKVRAFNQGVSSKPGQMIARPLATWRGNPAAADISAPNRRFIDRLLGKPKPVGHAVQTVTLDSHNLRNVSFIKMDVEGHEAEVLMGATELLARERPAMIIEIWEPDSPERHKRKTDAICAYGYEPHPISRVDTLFLPQR